MMTISLKTIISAPNYPRCQWYTIKSWYVNLAFWPYPWPCLLTLTRCPYPGHDVVVETVDKVRELHTEKLHAVDVTSSLIGRRLRSSQNALLYSSIVSVISVFFLQIWGKGEKTLWILGICSFVLILICLFSFLLPPPFLSFSLSLSFSLISLSLFPSLTFPSHSLSFHLSLSLSHYLPLHTYSKDFEANKL